MIPREYLSESYLINGDGVKTPVKITADFLDFWPIATVVKDRVHFFGGGPDDTRVSSFKNDSFLLLDLAARFLPDCRIRNQTHFCSFLWSRGAVN